VTLGAGTRLGPYDLTALVGEGGMGRVYRATDTNLGRQVAVKVLPQAFAQDADRLARFDREARTLASLNHPNIAHIYGLERSEGTTALVSGGKPGSAASPDRRRGKLVRRTEAARAGELARLRRTLPSVRIGP
jgi:serine/threonine protein kinase